jgi:predicted phage tail protein
MTDVPKNIQGAGGGGGGNPPPPPAPTRTPDTLHSRQFATFLDLISEGEIEGFETASKEGRTKNSTEYNTTAFKDVFLNDTPILRSQANSIAPQDSDFNFKDVGFKIRFGTANQTKLSGILSSSSIQSVGVTVQAGSPVTRQITNSNVDAVNITITFPQMQEAKENGDLLGSSVTLQIQVQYNGGGFSTVITDTITGRTADAYQRDYRVNLTSTFPVDIRVVRVTPDSTSSSLINSFNWTSFGEIIDDASTYANSAYTSLRLDSMQFQSIPTRKFRIRGIKVRIPGAGANNSGTPTVDSNGRIVYPPNYVFNGTLGAAQWCACPAMVLLDILTDTRYGLGNHIGDSAVDLFSFVTASKFANTLVSDGFGGQEARFSCNVNIQAASEAFDIINELAGVMRCMPIWSAGTLSLAQDSPKDASYLFTLANVTPAGFSYSGSSLKTRHTVISVSYFNMDTREIDFEVVEDAAAIAKFGVIIKQVKAFACTSRGQAARLGKAVLFTEQNESEIVSFSTSIDSGVVVRPGAVIEIADPVRSGLRRGGRVKSATTQSITVDDDTATSLPTTNNPSISVIMPDGTVRVATVSSIVGNVINIVGSLPQAPNPNTVWLIQDDTVKTQKFRVITVEESDGVNYAITALSYVNEKYAFIEDGSRLPDRTISVLNLPKPAPSGLVAQEKLVVINNQAVSKLIISWQPVTGVTQYQVNYRFNNGNFVSTTVSSPDFEIFNTSVGTYEIQVFSYNTALQLSPSSSNLSVNTVGKTAVPDDVSGLTIEPFSSKLVRLRWNISSDIDVTHGGFVYVRHSTKTDGTGTFANAVDLINALPGNSTQAVVPLLEGEYILKFQDDGGRFSTGETSIVIDLPDNVSALVTQTRREDLDNPKFQGAKTNTTFDASADALTLTNPSTNASGEYAFNTVLDLGGVFSLDLKRHLLSEGFYIGTLFDSRTALIDTWTDFDGAEATAVNAQLLVATTQDNPSSGSPTFTAFQTFANGTYKGRGFKFKTEVTSSDPAQNIRISQLGYTASLQRRVEQSNTLTANGSTNVTFTNTFFVGTSSLLGVNSNLPAIGITAQNLATGEFFQISNISGTGFTIVFKDSSNNAINGKQFTYQAVGFGKG